MPAWSCAARPTTTWRFAMPELEPPDPADDAGPGADPAGRAGAGGASARFRIGLLGHGTVGAALHDLIDERAGAIEATTGVRPEVIGVLTRSRGEFEDIV